MTVVPQMDMATNNDVPKQNCLRLKSKIEKYNQMKSAQVYSVHQVQNRLRDDLLACDARWSLFVAAITSYRYDALARPFPKDFMNCSHQPDIDRVTAMIGDMPRMEIILEEFGDGNYSRFEPDMMKLLYTLFVKHGDRVALSTVPISKHSVLLENLKVSSELSQPTNIFSVHPSYKMSHTRHYEALKAKTKDVKVGYYGGNLNTFYSMLTAGILPYGKPINLYSDMSEALKKSPPGAGWGGSRCGSVLRCVAVVDYVNIPEHVSVTVDEVSGKVSSVLIKDAKCMQITHLLVYGQSCAEYEASKPYNQVINWLDNNKHIISLGVYLMMISFSSKYSTGLIRGVARTGLNIFKRGFLRM